MNNLLICKGKSRNSCSFLAFLLFTFILIAPAAAQTLKEHDITPVSYTHLTLPTNSRV